MILMCSGRERDKNQSVQLFFCISLLSQRLFYKLILAFRGA